MLKDARDDETGDLFDQFDFFRPEKATGRTRQPGKTDEIRAESASSRRGGEVRFEAADFRPRWWPVEAM